MMGTVHHQEESPLGVASASDGGLQKVVKRGGIYYRLLNPRRDDIHNTHLSVSVA